MALLAVLDPPANLAGGGVGVGVAAYLAGLVVLTCAEAGLAISLGSGPLDELGGATGAGAAGIGLLLLIVPGLFLLTIWSMLVAVIAGVAVCAVGLGRGRWREAALPLLLVVLPLGIYK